MTTEKHPKWHEAARQLDTHDYRGDGIPDHHGNDRCLECRLDEDHPVHRHELRPVDPEVAEISQRITGEREVGEH